MLCIFLFFFFFNDTATTEIYTLSLHDALPILGAGGVVRVAPRHPHRGAAVADRAQRRDDRDRVRAAALHRLLAVGLAGGDVVAAGRRVVPGGVRADRDRGGRGAGVLRRPPGPGRDRERGDGRLRAGVPAVRRDVLAVAGGGGVPRRDDRGAEDPRGAAGRARGPVRPSAQRRVHPRRPRLDRPPRTPPPPDPA